MEGGKDVPARVTLMIAGAPLTFCRPPHVPVPKPGPCKGVKRAAATAVRPAGKAAGNPRKAPGAAGAAAAREIAEALKTGVKERLKAGHGASARVDILTLGNGRRVVHKVTRDNPHPLYGNLPAVQQQDAEELTAMVAHAVGAAAPAVYRKDDNTIYIDFVPDRLGLEYDIDEQMEAFRSPSGVRLALVDMLTGNSDRKDENFFLDKTAQGWKVTGIDHGMTFRGDNPLAAFYSPASANFRDGANPLHPDDVAVARRQIAALEPEFARRGRQEWYAQMNQQLEQLAGSARGTERIIT